MSDSEKMVADWRARHPEITAAWTSASRSVVQVDLDAIQKAALAAPRRGPFTVSVAEFGGLAGAPCALVDGSGDDVLLDDGYSGYVETDMLDFFSKVDPDTVLVLLALAKIGADHLQEKDRIQFSLPESPSA